MNSLLGQLLPVSWSALMRYAIISAINLAILLTGIAIGVMLAPRFEKTASANSEQQAASPQATPDHVDANGVKIISAKPSLSAGTIAAFLFLAHHIQSDELVVNGVDLVKLHQEEINMLARFVPQQDITAAIARCKVTEQYQVEGPQKPPSK